LRLELARAESPLEEVTMSKEERKAIINIQVFEADNGDNYEICGYVRVGGLKVEIDTDIDRVRDFFTKRKEGRVVYDKKSALKSVKE
jgi:hypothetical protein